MEKILTTCPGCEKTFKVDFSKLKSGDIIKCPHCKEDIEITGNLEGLRKVDKQIKLLEKTFDKGY